LASEETPTVLVDTSMQFGDVSVFLNLQPKTSIVDLAARAEEIDPEVIEDVLLVHESGLRVLPAPPRPEMADEIRAEQVRRVLQSLKRMFTYVLVDTGSAMDDVTLAVLDTADLLIAVASPDIPSIKDARQVFDLLDVLEFPKERVFFIINKMDRHSGITVEAIADNLKHTVRGSIPTDERVVAASINRGVPLLLGDRNKQPAKSILTILNKLKKIVTAELAYEGET
jgi:pilus assembly protein CpaE